MQLWLSWLKENTWRGRCIAMLMILISAIHFHVYETRDFGARMHFYQKDSGDYRYLAEHFWGVEHIYDSYTPVMWKRSFAHYMDEMPARPVGPGSYLLLLQAVVKWLNPEWAGYGKPFNIIFCSSLKLMLMAAYYVFYVSCARRYGAGISLACLGALLLPVGSWALTERHFLAEPLLRPFFVLMLAFLVRCYGPSRSVFSSLLGCLLLLILAAQMKPQWYLLSFILLGAALCIGWGMKMPAHKIGLWIAAAVAAPLGVLLVNIIGWNYYGIAPASAQHANLKSKGDFIRTVCATEPKDALAVFCNRDKSELTPWWNMYLGEEAKTQNFLALDKESLPYFLSHPENMMADFWRGLAKANNFIGGGWGLSAIVWFMLCIGVFWQQTRLLAAMGMGLWAIPAIGVMFAVYDNRYYMVMAGLPLAIAIMIAYEYILFCKDHREKHAT